MSNDNDAAKNWLEEIFRKLRLRWGETGLPGMFTVNIRSQSMQVLIGWTTTDEAWDAVGDYVHRLIADHVYPKLERLQEQWQKEERRQRSLFGSLFPKQTNFTRWEREIAELDQHFIRCEASLYLHWCSFKKPTEAATLYCRGYEIIWAMQKQRETFLRLVQETKANASAASVERIREDIEEARGLVARHVTSFLVRQAMK